MITFSEYAKHDALGLAGLVRKGDVSPLELVEAAIARAEAVNGKLYMMGGAWDGIYLRSMADPASFSIAVGIVVPWHATNVEHLSLHQFLSGFPVFNV